MSRALRPPPGQDVNCQRSDRPQQGEDHANPCVHPAKIRMGSGAGHLRDVPEEPAGCPGSLLRIRAYGVLGEQPVQLRPSCRLSSGQGSRWHGWIGRWRSSRAYLRGGRLPNGTGSRYRRGSLRVGLHQPLASSCPGAVPGVRAQRTPPHSDRRRQSDGGLSGLPAPLGSVRPLILQKRSAALGGGQPQQLARVAPEERAQAVEGWHAGDRIPRWIRGDDRRWRPRRSNRRPARNDRRSNWVSAPV